MTTRRPTTRESTDRPSAGPSRRLPGSESPEDRAPVREKTPAEFLTVCFKQPELLTLALTHRSLAYETNSDALDDPQSDNEQLEFLGDAVLGMIVAESLYRRFPGSREGELTRLRASIISRQHLGEVALRMDLGSVLRLGRGEENSGGRSKPALLSNALEAVIAAVFLDAGLDQARNFVEQHIVTPALPSLEQAIRGGDTFSGAIGDHKSALQEHLQGIGAGQPLYVVTAESGPDHDKRFRIQVRVEDGKGGSIAVSESEGSTKKKAQQEAARLAFEHLLANSMQRGLPGIRGPVNEP